MDLTGRAIEAEGRALRAAFTPLVLAARDVAMNARAGEPIEGVRHKRVRADLVERLMDAYQDTFGLYEAGEHPADAQGGNHASD